MIPKLTRTVILGNEYAVLLNSMHPFKGTDWNHSSVEKVREAIEAQLRTFQSGKCCFCGLYYDETGRAEVEHIAPKNAKKISFPQFSFEPYNLAMACQLCNSSTMKGQYNPIEVYSDNYVNCKFKIVHPYLHDPDSHYKWSSGALEILVTGISDEGKESIRLFKLASEHRSSARAKQRNHDLLKALFNFPQATLERIRKAIDFRGR